jgi:hypothetical protein
MKLLVAPNGPRYPTTAGSCGSRHDLTSALSTIRSRAHRSDENRRHVQHLGARADARGAEAVTPSRKRKQASSCSSPHTSCSPKQGAGPACIHGTGEETASRSPCMLSPRCECRVRVRGAPAADDEQASRLVRVRSRSGRSWVSLASCASARSNRVRAFFDDGDLSALTPPAARLLSQGFRPAHRPRRRPRRALSASAAVAATSFPEATASGTWAVTAGPNPRPRTS